ncbi:MAG TPA: [FeFe] hydrogenase H-cluster radical SAM maturase HydE [Desulfomonilia bacterium]
MSGELEKTKSYNKSKIIKILSEDDPSALLAEADEARRNYIGDEVYLRGIIEFSNYCIQDCHYCGLGCNNNKLERYRMSDDEILSGAREILKSGIGTVVLQSGEDTFYSTQKIVSLIKRIKDETGLVITLSTGEWPLKAFELFKEAGADRYLLKHETSDGNLYKQIKSGGDQSYRIKCLKHLKTLGFETGSGVMVGLPGQTLESLAGDIMMFKELDIDMIGIGPFIPHPDTLLAGNPAGSPELVLKMIALTRIVTRNTNIPATTALTTIDPKNRVRSLMAGANVIMPDFTPAKYRKLYEIYPGKGSSPAEPSEIMDGIRRDIEAAGRIIGPGPGNRRNN